ncbi:putative homeobox transcription factor [Heterostelium album PN500]|uniref:Putative homeobox transcription factor n=1 Tax=Heterostelium pallidum (strain ATCC 26659 / Pp 5 / PN500) TaxID=670386 RepID=D3BI39_HETP5|nr:putative homeobox transcription factor [Heterostelium album PN500]EFA78939.1 putative homeobox transcription factor [Heterostelium album PN500]|eukprot:XP_020431063.1 putative homeobox transcription factor [Heterostelium album PN500]
MEIIQEQNQIFANFQQYKQRAQQQQQLQSMSSLKPIDTATSSANSIDTIIHSGSGPVSPISSDSDSLSVDEKDNTLVTPGCDDEREIGLVANILLNISSVGIPSVPSSSNFDVSSSASSVPIMNLKLTDSSNVVPFESTSNVIGEDSRQSVSLNNSISDLRTSGSGIPPVINPLSQSLQSTSAYKKKRQRTSPEQLAILEQIFETDKMPSQQIRIRLANQLGMSSRRVQIWFQNKRAKVKRGVFTKGDGDDDVLDDEAIDEEDMDDDTSLTIDESSGSNLLNSLSSSLNGMNSLSNNSSPISMGMNGLGDNIVPSISPLMLATNPNPNMVKASSMMSHFSLGQPIPPSTSSSSSLSSSSSSIKTIKPSLSSNSLTSLAGSTTSTTTTQSSPTSSTTPALVPSPTNKRKKTSRPSSPTSGNNTPLLSPIAFQPTSSTLPSLSQIKLNSSSAHIPTNNSFKPYTFPFDNTNNTNNNNNNNTNNTNNNAPTNSSGSSFESLRFAN